MQTKVVRQCVDLLVMGLIFGLGVEAFAAGNAASLQVSKKVLAEALSIPEANLSTGKKVRRANLEAAFQVASRLSGMSPKRMYEDFVRSVEEECKRGPSQDSCGDIVELANRDNVEFVIR